MPEYWRFPKSGYVFRDAHMTDGAREHARPVVVIDPADIEQLTRLADLMLAAASKAGLRYVTFASVFGDERGAIVESALREFVANPTPPRPDEPTNLGAIVEDTDGNPWVRADHGENAWVYGTTGWRTWDEIDVARIVSQGTPS